MLNDWEEEQLHEMESELRGDKALQRVLRAPSALERRWLVFRRNFYPVGYLACAVTYMLAAGAGQPAILAGACVTGLAAWLVVEVASLSGPRP